VRRLTLVIVLAGALPLAARAEERFPPPDFESGYKLPVTTTPPPRSDVLEYVDVAVLAAALVAASILVLRVRSRRAVFVLMAFSLAYFGFYRQGCVCAIGAIQNVTLGLADPAYTVPLAVVAFFAAPLVFTLLFGRTFCAAVCPLGAIQDVVLLRPVRVPAWVEHGLGLVPYVYLGLAVLFAATGSAFIICEYDPFVALFRRSGSVAMLGLGVGMLLVSVFVGRAYCRFLCPLGAIFKVLSPLAWWHATITPAECIRCRLCEDACPFAAIRPPTADAHGPRAAGMGRLAALLALAPVLVALGAGTGRLLAPALARMHATVRLSDRIRLEEAGEVTETTEASDAFRIHGSAPGDLYAEAAGIEAGFGTGGWLLGGWVGLVVAAKLLHLSIRRTRADYLPDRGRCLSCARCFAYCPVEAKGPKERKA